MLRIALVALLLAPTAVLARTDYGAPGPWAVGTMTITFTKTSETTGLPRRMATRIWYPRGKATGTSETIQPNAPVFPKRWPLVVFSHGSCGTPDQSVFFTAGLASWGFVVAAPPHPGNTTADIPGCFDAAAVLDSFKNRVADVSFVIDQLSAAPADSPFAHRVNPKRIGMSGHSLGGQTTLRVLAADKRVRAGVALAPTVQNIADLRIKRAAMVLTGAIDSVTPFDTEARGAYALLHGPRFLLELARSGHCAFSVACVPNFCGNGCDATALNATDAHRETLTWAVPFLLRYVTGHRVGSALHPSTTPDVQVLEAHPHK